MHTQISPDSLKNPAFAEADDILKSCTQCGLCNATCPSYIVKNDERDSPRGRIRLIKNMFEQNGQVNATIVKHTDRCLLCYACMTTCPADVNFKDLISLTRIHIEKSKKRPMGKKFMHRMLVSVLPHPGRMKMALIGARVARPLSGFFQKIGLRTFGSILTLVPHRFTSNSGVTSPGLKRADKREASQKKRVMLLQGCSQQVINPNIQEATIKILQRNGVEIVIPPRSECCGAFDYNIGKNSKAIAYAKKVVNTYTKIQDKTPVDAILIPSTSCGNHLKNYAHILRDESGFAKRAETLASKVRDVSEFLMEDIELRSALQWADLKIAYHTPCSLIHGQKTGDFPKKLLKKSGYAITEIPENNICCGGSGIYNFTENEISQNLRERKIDKIKTLKSDLITSSNLGCLLQLEGDLAQPVIHLIELVAWAQTGECPPQLKHLEEKVQKVDDFIGMEEEKEEARKKEKEEEATKASSSSIWSIPFQWR